MMDAKEARNIVLKGKEHHVLGHTYDPFIVREAAGYIAALNGPEVKALVEALDRLAYENAVHEKDLAGPYNCSAECEGCKGIEALKTFRQQTGAGE